MKKISSLSKIFGGKANGVKKVEEDDMVDDIKTTQPSLETQPSEKKLDILGGKPKGTRSDQLGHVFGNDKGSMLMSPKEKSFTKNPFSGNTEMWASLKGTFKSKTNVTDYFSQPKKQNNTMNNYFSKPKKQNNTMNNYFSKPKKQNNVINNFFGNRDKNVNTKIGNFLGTGIKKKVNNNFNVQNKIAGMIGGGINNTRFNQKIAKKNTPNFNIQAKIAAMTSVPKGAYKNTQNVMFGRLMQQKHLSRFGDADRDGVANILDCRPLNYFKQGPEHNDKLSQKEVDILTTTGESVLPKLSEEEETGKLARGLEQYDTKREQFALSQTLNADPSWSERNIETVSGLGRTVAGKIGEKLEDRQERKSLREEEKGRPSRIDESMGLHIESAIRSNSSIKKLDPAHKLYYEQHKEELTGISPKDEINIALQKRAMEHIKSGKDTKDVPPEVKKHLEKKTTSYLARQAGKLKDVLFKKEDGKTDLLKTPYATVKELDKLIKGGDKFSRELRGRDRYDSRSSGDNLMYGKAKVGMMSGGGLKGQGMALMTGGVGSKGGFFSMAQKQPIGGGGFAQALYGRTGMGGTFQSKIGDVVGMKSGMGAGLGMGAGHFDSAFKSKVGDVITPGRISSLSFSDKAKDFIGKPGQRKKIELGPDMFKSLRSQEMVDMPIEEEAMDVDEEEVEKAQIEPVDEEEVLSRQAMQQPILPPRMMQPQQPPMPQPMQQPPMYPQQPPMQQQPPMYPQQPSMQQLYQQQQQPTGGPSSKREGQVWSERSKKYVDYPRGKYKKHEDRYRPEY